jgi:D-beta-D-heptose 7-phosphate kinase/D-beta-D-heptose 1-phosphate adenosyltransferase
MRTIFTNGCFDIIHRGHIELLKYCKSLGYVIVGLNSDQSVKRLKGQSRPINSQEDRKELLSSLRFVDQVIIFEDDTPLNLIKEIKPDIIVKGGDYEKEKVVGNEIAKVIIYDYIEGYSTTRVIQSLTDR